MLRSVESRCWALATHVGTSQRLRRHAAFASAAAAALLGLACVAGSPGRGSAAPSTGSPPAAAGVPFSPAAAPALPKYPASTVPLSRDSAYLRSAASNDFWALGPYYVGQQDDVSCSLASLTMLVNAARRHERLGTDEPLVVQAQLRRRVNSPIWERGLAPGGDGVTLDELATLAEESLRAYGLPPSHVEVTHVPDASPAALARLRAALGANEANGDDWLFVNFLAAAYVGVGDYGHIAPVGAYDAASRRVLLFDPDRTWYEPYWVPDDVLLAGMATRDPVTGAPRGYLHVSRGRSE